MDKKKGILGYLSQVFIIYGAIALLLNVSCMIFGEDAKSISTIFSLGNDGLPVYTSFQFLGAIALIVALRVVLLTDVIFKRIRTAMRVILLFSGCLAITIGFVFAFKWFPVTNTIVWVMFAGCFIVSCTIGTLISVLAEKQENKKLEEALRRFKEEK